MFFLLKRKKEPALSPDEQLIEWEKKGNPAPPPHIIKQQVIREYKERFGIETLVETGTYFGEMIEAQIPFFKKLFSVELSKKLFRRAKKKFSHFTQVSLFQGDSGIVLEEIIEQINAPAIFWLDGHYSGGVTARGKKECPVPQELKAIFSGNYHHVILIDDARLFTGENDYPTVEQIAFMVKAAGKNYDIEIKDDIIRLIPNY